MKESSFETIANTIVGVLTGLVIIELLFGENNSSKEFKRKRNYIDRESSKRANQALNNKLTLKP